MPLRRLGVRFKNVTTWGVASGGEGERLGIKTFPKAIGRSLVGIDLYEWFVKPLLRKEKKVPKRALIRDASGLVRDGEMML